MSEPTDDFIDRYGLDTMRKLVSRHHFDAASAMRFIREATDETLRVVELEPHLADGLRTGHTGLRRLLRRVDADAIARRIGDDPHRVRMGLGTLMQALGPVLARRARAAGGGAAPYQVDRPSA